MKKIFNVLFKLSCFVVMISMASCVSRRNTIYLQDMDELQEYPVIQKYEAVIHRDDKLSIIVSCKEPELALPFNMPGTGTYSVSPTGEITGTNNTLATTKDAPGYLVDVRGQIDFPILGKLNVEGLTRNQLVELIKARLVDEGLLKDPIVQVNFLNFRFYTLGGINSVGVKEITGDRITLLEAISMAGGISAQGRIDRVGVIREYGNKRRILFHDLRSKDIFLSPCYYLQQNDIIYVEPNGQQAQEQNYRRYSAWSMVLSFISTMTSLILLYTKI